MPNSVKTKRRRIEVRCREIPESFKIDQLYGVLNASDIHINGSITMADDCYEGIERVKVCGNLCSADGAILYILDGWKNYPVRKGSYNSFSLFCYDVDRFIDEEELSYAELYLSYNEEDI